MKGLTTNVENLLKPYDLTLARIMMLIENVEFTTNEMMSGDALSKIILDIGEYINQSFKSSDLNSMREIL